MLFLGLLAHVSCNHRQLLLEIQLQIICYCFLFIIIVKLLFYMLSSQRKFSQSLIDERPTCFSSVTVVWVSYLSRFGLQVVLLLNNLLLQTADLQFEAFNLRFLLAVWTQLWREAEQEKRTRHWAWQNTRGSVSCFTCRYIFCMAPSLNHCMPQVIHLTPTFRSCLCQTL